MLKQITNSSDLQVNGIDYKTVKISNLPASNLTPKEVKLCPADENKKLSVSSPATLTVRETSPRKALKKKGSKIKYLIDQSSYIDTLHHKTIKVTCFAFLGNFFSDVFFEKL